MPHAKFYRRKFLTDGLSLMAAGVLAPSSILARLAAGPLSRSAAFPKIDIHVHLGRDSREMREMTSGKVPEAANYLVTQMDSHHIEKALIVAIEPIFPTPLYLQAAKLHPERLLVACSVSPRPIGEAVEKLKSYRDQGARALKLQPMQYHPSDPAVERLVYEAVKLDMPVLFHHTDTPKTFPDMLSHFASTFHDGKFVIIHFGGVHGFADVLPLARLPNVYLETSTAFPRIVKSPLKSRLHFLVEENSLQKLVFGSELPDQYPVVFEAIEELIGENPKPEVLKAVYRGNAERILKLS